MAETTTPTSTPATGAFSAGLKNLLDTGLNVFTGYTNGLTAKAQENAAKAQAKAAQANAQGQQYSSMKYIVIGVAAVIAAVVLMIVLFKKK